MTDSYCFQDGETEQDFTNEFTNDFFQEQQITELYEDLISALIRSTENPECNFENGQEQSIPPTESITLLNNDSNIITHYSNQEKDVQQLLDSDVWYSNTPTLEQYQESFQLMQPAFFPMRYDNYFGYSVVFNNAEELNLAFSQKSYPYFKIKFPQVISESTKRKINEKANKMRNQLKSKRNETISMQDLESQIVNIKYHSPKVEASKTKKQRGRPKKTQNE